MSAYEFDQRFGDLLNPEEQSKLGIASAPTKTQLTSDQQATINNAKAFWDAKKQLMQATPEARKYIIDKSIRESGFDPSPYF